MLYVNVMGLVRFITEFVKTTVDFHSFVKSFCKEFISVAYTLYILKCNLVRLKLFKVLALSEIVP